jgi:nitrate reductase gamma subunit
MASWHKSRTVFNLFWYSSWIVIFMGLFMAFMLTPWFKELQGLPSGQLILRVIGGAAGVLGTPASLILLFGIAIFCIFEDSSSVGKKIVWFILFFATACFGAAAYFFTVYRRQVEFESR